MAQITKPSERSKNKAMQSSFLTPTRANIDLNDRFLASSVAII